MTGSASHHLSQSHNHDHSPDGHESADEEQPEPVNSQNEIPVEIVSEEEMTLIEAALLAAAAATRPSFSTVPSCASTSPSSLSLISSQFHLGVRLIESITLLSKRGLCSPAAVDGGRRPASQPIPDIEDTCRVLSPPRKKGRASESLLSRFRRKRALSATDFTGSEWCEKQMEFKLCLGKVKVSEAMKAGIARHTKLEEEVMTRVEVRVKSKEDIWALKLINFIAGVNQLHFEGLTRELPIIGLVEGSWMVGVIDELQMPLTGFDKRPIFVDTKTRVRAKLPEEPQQRNGRLQLMCYRYLWDNLVAENFSPNMFYYFFALNPRHTLSGDLRKITTESGFPTETLDELVEYFRNVCSTLPNAHDQLLLRYELQKDNSLIGEDEFTYDACWLKDKLCYSLQFWRGERAANYVTEEESWKCRCCQYASVCPSQSDQAKTTLL